MKIVERRRASARLYSPGDRNHHRRRTWPSTLPRSRKKTLPAATRKAQREREHELDDGDDRDEQEVRRDPVREEEHQEAERDQSRTRSRRRRPSWPTTGRTIFGNWICLMSWSWLTIEAVASVDRGGEPLPGQDRREDEERVVGLRLRRDDRDEDDVDDHLEQRVEDPPDVAEEGVRAALAHVGLDEVADEPASGPDVGDALPDQGERTSVVRRRAERSRDFTGGGHRGEGYHLAAGRPPSEEAVDEAIARASVRCDRCAAR